MKSKREVREVHVLVIESNPVEVRTYRILLEGLAAVVPKDTRGEYIPECFGMDIVLVSIAAKSPEEAIALLRQSACLFDVVLTDASGLLDFAKEAVAMGIPVIGRTLNPREQQAFVREGITCYLKGSDVNGEKPVLDVCVEALRLAMKLPARKTKAA